MSKKCTSCGKFPFCKFSKNETDSCDNFTKREIETRLIYKDGENFEFERIDK